MSASATVWKQWVQNVTSVVLDTVEQLTSATVLSRCNNIAFCKNRVCKHSIRTIDKTGHITEIFREK